MLSALSKRDDSEIDRKVRLENWTLLTARLAERGCFAKGLYGPERELRNVVCGVLSAKAGRPIWYNFEKLIQVAHHLAEQFPAALLPFGYALRMSGHDAMLRDQDKNGKWEKRAKGLREAMRAGEPSFRLKPHTQALVAFLFPEIADRVKGSRRVE